MSLTHFLLWQPYLNSFILIIFGLLVMLMAFGCIFFGVGMVQTKNTTTFLAKNLSALALALLFSFFFGEHLIYADLNTVNFRVLSAHFFHAPLTFIPLGIIALASAERIKTWAFIFFIAIVASIIYPLQASWLWNNGFLTDIDFIDKAGAGIIYLTGAMAGLIASLIVGPRQNKYQQNGRQLPIRGANLPLTYLGLLLFWLGSFAAHAGVHTSGEALGNVEYISIAFINTSVAAASAALICLLVTRIYFGFIDITIMMNGILAGLVSIAAFPASPYLQTIALTGAIAGFLCVLSITLLENLQIDDPAGAISSFGIGGLWGLLAVVFTRNYPPLAGDQTSWLWFHTLLHQIYGIAIIMAWVGITSTISLYSIKYLMGLRFPELDEHRGLDIIDCGMPAYPEFTQTER